MSHHFTRDEAEALLPAITVILRLLQEQRRRIQDIEEKLAVLQIQARGNGHNLHERSRQLQQEESEYAQMMQENIATLRTLGCTLKDVESGLVDFLSLRAGVEVYLCWRLGEERINFWHPLDTGFAGRQPIDE